MGDLFDDRFSSIDMAKNLVISNQPIYLGHLFGGQTDCVVSESDKNQSETARKEEKSTNAYTGRFTKGYINATSVQNTKESANGRKTIKSTSAETGQRQLNPPKVLKNPSGRKKEESAYAYTGRITKSYTNVTSSQNTKDSANGGNTIESTNDETGKRQLNPPKVLKRGPSGRKKEEFTNAKTVRITKSYTNATSRQNTKESANGGKTIESTNAETGQRQWNHPKVLKRDPTGRNGKESANAKNGRNKKEYTSATNGPKTKKSGNDLNGQPIIASANSATGKRQRNPPKIKKSVNDLNGLQIIASANSVSGKRQGNPPKILKRDPTSRQVKRKCISSVEKWTKSSRDKSPAQKAVTSIEKKPKKSSKEAGDIKQMGLVKSSKRKE